jgi:hypothetical protein
MGASRGCERVRRRGAGGGGDGWQCQVSRPSLAGESEAVMRMEREGRTSVALGTTLELDCRRLSALDVVPSGIHVRLARTGYGAWFPL